MTSANQTIINVPVITMDSIITPSWFTDITCPDDPEGSCHPDIVLALKDFYETKAGADETAHKFADLLIKNHSSVSSQLDINTARNILFSILADSLVCWPESKIEALFTLLQKIQTLPEPVLPDVKTEQQQQQQQRSALDPPLSCIPKKPFWKDLPGFGNGWADLFQWGEWEQEIEKNPLDMSLRESLRKKYVRVAAVEAQLCKRQIGGIPIDWGYECITNGLERSNAVLDFQVPMAAEWLMPLARRIYEGALDGEKSWALPRESLDLWHGGQRDTMTMERWKFWKSRFETYVGGVNAPERDLVARVVQIMNGPTFA